MNFILSAMAAAADAKKKYGGTDGAGLPPRLSEAALAATFGSKAVVDAAQYANAATAANTRLVMSKLRRGMADVSILNISDSTGNETTEWFYKLAQFLATKFPAYTVQFSFWDETGGVAYQTATTIQTGTGAKTLRFWDAAKTGEIPGYVLGTRWAAAVTATAPDLVFVNHGHNMSDPTSVTWSEFVGRNTMFSLTEELTATFPRAGLVLIAQNPSKVAGRETWQAIKASAWEEAASLRGYGFIDVHQSFIDYGAWQTALMADDTHPNATGSQIWADVVIAAFQDERKAVVPSVMIPPLLTTAKNYLDNGDFSAWASTDPDSWVPTASATTSKDTTNFESSTQACKVTGTATTGAAQIEQTINLTTKGYHHLKGQVVTLAVRVYVPAANTGTVRIALVDSTGGANASNMDIPTSTRGRYVWLFSSKRIDTGNTIYVRLMSRTSGTAIMDASFDRAYLVRGVLPQCG
jgi:hypothetical protein